MQKAHRIEIKICGLTNAADACLAVDLGADYLGVVFFAGSPRAVSVKNAQAIRRMLPPATRLIGVFVDESRKKVIQTAEECGLFAVQLHGSEDFNDFPAMPIPVWRSVHCRSNGAWQPKPETWPVARYVVDSFHAGRRGGTGMVADWPRARILASHNPCMLAGGLTPDNVAEAIRCVKPCGVDVASGVESAPGHKDNILMRRFFDAARNAAMALSDEVTNE